MTKEQKNICQKLLAKLKKSTEQEIAVNLDIKSDEAAIKEEVENNNIIASEEDAVVNSNIVDFQTKKQLSQANKLNEINIALQKIENNTYGICEESGEEIDFKRLCANPTARFSIEVQKILEENKQKTLEY